jgi:hypothetical protein
MIEEGIRAIYDYLAVIDYIWQDKVYLFVMIEYLKI